MFAIIWLLNKVRGHLFFMNNITLTEELKIENMIYEIRGKQVMVESDLAKLYGVETKRINESVRRNFEKFPERYCFKLNKKEYLNILRSQNATLELKRGQYSKYLPRVFTEQGVAMLATILKSNVATQVSIAIMDAFVNMCHYILENKDILRALNNINNKLIEHDEKIDYIFAAFDKKEQLFLPNESYDAYLEIVDIITKVKEEIIIIDIYADKTILDFIRNVNAKIILIISDKAKLNDLELEKFNEQYNKLKVIKIIIFMIAILYLIKSVFIILEHH